MTAFIGNFLRSVLVSLYNLTGNHGVAIIVLTLMIRIGLLPLTLSQTRSAAAMRDLQPQIKEIQEKYKDKPQEQQERMMALYKKAGVNPLGGCLPLLVQLPVIWALFAVLRDFPAGIPAEAFAKPFSAAFLIWDLSVKDPTYVLPILSGLTTYFQQRSITTMDASQQGMLLMMPLFLTWVSLSFPAGLVVYWVVGNLFTIVQQKWFAGNLGLKQGGSEAR